MAYTDGAATSRKPRGLITLADFAVEILALRQDSDIRRRMRELER
jgi:hypothetical protein